MCRGAQWAVVSGWRLRRAPRIRIRPNGTMLPAQNADLFRVKDDIDIARACWLATHIHIFQHSKQQVSWLRFNCIHMYIRDWTGQSGLYHVQYQVKVKLYVPNAKEQVCYRTLRFTAARDIPRWKKQLIASKSIHIIGQNGMGSHKRTCWLSCKKRNIFS